MQELVGYHFGSCNVNRLLGVYLAHTRFVRKQGIRCLLSLHTQYPGTTLSTLVGTIQLHVLHPHSIYTIYSTVEPTLPVLQVFNHARKPLRTSYMCMSQIYPFFMLLSAEAKFHTYRRFVKRILVHASEFQCNLKLRSYDDTPRCL